MNDAAVKVAVDRFLKHVSFTAQREIEKVVRSAVSSGKLQNGEPLAAAVTLSSDQLELDITIFSKIEL
jgi:Family of unknown function (DUF6494)